MPEQVTDERIKEGLLAILETVEKEDETLRLQQGREFKKLNLFWHGFQYLFWSDIDQDWRIPTHEQYEEITAREETRYVFDTVINITKAHGESIIAAMSADIPEVRFGPRNAQDPTDNRAVEAADNTVQLIQKWNRAKLKIIEALFFLSTEGFVASYTYNKKDLQYGKVDVPEYGTQPQQVPGAMMCEECGYQEPAPETGGDPTQAPQESPVGGSPSADNPMETPSMTGEPEPEINACPECQVPMTQQPPTMEDMPILMGSTPTPKGREIIEIYGRAAVRMPSYVSKQADAGYLVHYVDADPALFKETYRDHEDEIDSDSGQEYERSLRQSSLSMDGFQLNYRLGTQKRCWFRPWMVQRLGPGFDDVKDHIRTKFPDGIHFSVIGTIMCEPARSESMDDHWTITKAGPSKGIDADPILKSLLPLQELHNNLVNLFVMQVEYGVPATYADTEVYDFAGQSKQETVPGYTYPVTPRPGQRISDAFYTEKTTQLSKEATQLLEFIKESEQFVSGSFPSIYGGAAQGGSKTLGEYEKSRSFALQRLSLVWYFVNVWWGETMHKCLKSFMAHQIEDEPLTTGKPGSWQTSWIKKADLKGSFDRIEPDASADFPVSFGQKRSTLMALLQLGNEEVNSVLTSPENAALVQSYVGLTDLKIPFEGQRRKQMDEILDLISMPPHQLGDGGFESTVPVEPDIDDHDVHMEVLKNFLVEYSRDLKVDNAAGYGNCLAHLNEHKQYLMMEMQQQQQQQMASQAPPPGAPAPGKGAPPKPNGKAPKEGLM